MLQAGQGGAEAQGGALQGPGRGAQQGVYGLVHGGVWEEMRLERQGEASIIL